MPIASQANSHAIGSIGVRILCSDVTILFVIRMRSPIPAFRHPPNLRSPESSLTLVVQESCITFAHCFRESGIFMQCAPYFGTAKAVSQGTWR